MTSVSSSYSVESKVRSKIEKATIDSELIEIIVGTDSINDENFLWDFKIKLPYRNTQDILSPSQKKDFKAEFDEIVKDAVSFYNSYGGYIISGVQDNPRVIVGYAEQFNIKALNDRIESVTGVNIECKYRIIKAPINGEYFDFGIIFMPRRSMREKPAQFLSQSHKNSNNDSPCFNKNQVYLRKRDSCEPAQTLEDFSFLFTSERGFLNNYLSEHKVSLYNNLPPRDGELGDFIGRKENLINLWRWLGDSLSPIHLICGLGGLGKTSLAYYFSEQIIYAALSNYQKLIWLGAKKQTWQASLGQLVNANRIDFSNVESFFRQLAVELACLDEEIDDLDTVDLIIPLCIKYLQNYKFILIVDDVDTLSDNEQQELKEYISHICSTTGTKALLTARRTLGLPPGFYTELSGIEEYNFKEFLLSKIKLMGMQKHETDILNNEKKLFSASGGSPLFVMSIFRLVLCGEKLNAAIEKWRGADGEKVREAAFAREINRLKVDQAKILLVCIYMKETSILEIRHLTDIGQYEIEKNMDELRNIFMIFTESSLPGGANIKAPKMLERLVSIVESRVRNFSEIKNRCHDFKKIQKNPQPFISSSIRRSMAVLSANEPQVAVDIINESLKKFPEDPSLLCMAGRCYVANNPKDLGGAIDYFQKAFDKGCTRYELFELWIEVLEKDKNWDEIIKVCSLGEQSLKCCGKFTKNLCNAYKEKGAIKFKVGKYREALTIYDEIIILLTENMKKFNNEMFVSDAKQLRVYFGKQWIGCVAVESNTPNEYGRLLGAVKRIFSITGYVDTNSLKLSVDLADKYFNRRRQISSTGSSIEKIQRSRKNYNILSDCLKTRSIYPELAQSIDNIVAKIDSETE